MNDGSSGSIVVAPGIIVTRGLDPQRVDAYWSAVRETLRRVFNRSGADDIADAARDRLRHASAETREMFYHASPFQVASDLAGVTEIGLNGGQLANYRAIIEAYDPTLYPPRR